MRARPSFRSSAPPPGRYSSFASNTVSATGTYQASWCLFSVFLGTRAQQVPVQDRAASTAKSERGRRPAPHRAGTVAPARHPHRSPGGEALYGAQRHPQLVAHHLQELRPAPLQLVQRPQVPHRHNHRTARRWWRRSVSASDISPKIHQFATILPLSCTQCSLSCITIRVATELRETCRDQKHSIPTGPLPRRWTYSGHTAMEPPT